MVRKTEAAHGWLHRHYLLASFLIGGLLGLPLAYWLSPPPLLLLNTPEIQGQGLTSNLLSDLQVDDDFLSSYLRNSMTDSSERLVQRYRMTGTHEPLLAVGYSHPDFIRKGDEGKLLVRVRCINCSDKEIALKVVSRELVVTSQTEEPITITGDTDVTREFILSAGTGTTGLKTILIIATSEPSHRSLAPLTAKIYVAPPLGPFGIPEPYLDFGLKVLGLGSVGMFFAWLFSPRRRKQQE